MWLKLSAARAGYTVQGQIHHLAHNRLVDYYRATARSLPVSYADDCPEWDDLPAPAEEQLESGHTGDCADRAG